VDLDNSVPKNGIDPYFGRELSIPFTPDHKLIAKKLMGAKIISNNNVGGE